MFTLQTYLNNGLSELLLYIYLILLLLFIYRHFDKDKSGKLNHQEFKSCLRALGYDLPMVEEGQRDPEFENILDMVDPNRSVIHRLITMCHGRRINTFVELRILAYVL